MYCFFPLACIVLDTALGGLFLFYLFSVDIQGIIQFLQHIIFCSFLLFS